MKNIKSFRLFENSSYIDILNKDPKIVEWLLTARFANEYEGFYEYEPIDIITPYGEKINADFGSADDDYTGEGDWSFSSSYVDDYGILYQVFGFGKGYDYDTAYEGLEWDNEISNVEFSDVFNAPKLIVRIHKEYPLIAGKIYNLCDDPTKELIRIKLELSGMDNKETLSLFKGGSLLNRFGDI
jgi:hypothetical protein